tara:strand:+ start:812 stop:1273 length:462 start_codon:yes stop_codon:yes gene_type:complete
MSRKVIFISGEICSGKDTVMNRDYSADFYKQIDLGQLVREKFQTADRIFDNNLEPYFVERVKEITADNKFTYIITGLRQPSLAQKLSALFDEVKHIYLTVPRDILEWRYGARADVKDANISFKDAIAGDQSLGMKDLQYYLLTEVKCDFINNY